MKRNDLSRLEATVREANPVPEPSDLVDSEESTAVALLVTQGRRTMASTPTPQPPRRESLPSPTGHRAGASAAAFDVTRTVGVSAAAFAVTILAIGVVALLQQGGDSPVTGQATTITATTTAAPTTSTSVVTTTVPAPPVVTPALGEGWDIVLSSRPGDSPPLGGASVSISEAGYYVETFANDKYLKYVMRRDDDAGTLVDIGVPGSGGFVTGGPGVIAWANVGPESRTEAQLWVSSDGIDFERVAVDVFSGCVGSSDCRGSEIYAAAGAPSGRVVALGYDPLVWNAECECYELKPVAVVSDNGYEWTRQPLDLLSVLPGEWQGAADIRNPLVYVKGRWLTYATHYSNDCMCADTAFFASENGLEWQLIDTGDLFDETFLHGMAANDRGVVALAPEAAYWSPDGIEWTRSTLSDAEWTQQVAAYDNGYVVSSVPRSPDGAGLSSIWYSADGTNWSWMPLELEEPTHWNTLVGDGPYLVAIGGTETGLNGVWRWSQ